MSYAIGVVGATGRSDASSCASWTRAIAPACRSRSVRLFASERSAGKRITVRGEELVVERAEPDPAALFKGLDFVLTAIGDEQAKDFSPAIAEAGALNVDKSNAWRMDPDVPLVVPEVNPDAARSIAASSPVRTARPPRWSSRCGRCIA